MTPLRPLGKVVLDAEPALDYEARSAGGEIAANGRVRVLEVQSSGWLIVEPLAAAD